MSTDLKRLSAKHVHLIRLYVQGLDIGRIEKTLGFCEGYGSKILNTPLVQAKIKEMQDKLDDNTIDAVDNSRALIAENASRIAANIVEKALHASKDELQVSAGIQALKFAEGGKAADAGPQTSVNIFLRGEDGSLEKVDIYKSAFVGGDPSEDQEEGRKALELMEGDGEHGEDYASKETHG